MDYITASELALILAVFCGPVFAIAAVAQWRLLSGVRRRGLWLLTGLLLQAMLAFIVWTSPLHRHFLSPDFLGSLFSIGSIPLQAAVIATLAVTLLASMVVHVVSRPGR